MTFVPRPRLFRSVALASIVVAAVALPGCSSLSFERTTETSGTFRSTGFAFTIFSIDLPKGAQLIARENASDANLANMEVTDTVTFPYLGPFDWILDIISFRWSKVEGTWGYAPRP
ncbi:MAG: hypothetical protein NTY35_14640 [Planctomycetota bacterium]|nr:hypothetical protein [Planctomycetota bacterium]